MRRFFIVPEEQHKGLGKDIAYALEKAAISGGKQILDLECFSVAVNFWKKLGYAIEKEEFIPLENGKRLDYFRMIKTLTNKK